MKIIKSRTYNVINTEPFDMPLPLEFELMSGNALLATYTIHENGQVDYKFNGSSKERILTSTVRPLELNDIYFLFSSRVFQDKTPFTQSELERFGVEEYNPYEIARKTHGIIPGNCDRYWFKFSGEDLTFKKALDNFDEYFKVEESDEPEQNNEATEDSDSESNTIYSLDSIMNQKSNEYTSINDAGSILQEGKLDVASLVANIDDTPITETAFAAAKPGGKEINPGDGDANAMSEGDIAALLAASGNDSAPEPVAEPEPEKSEESSGGNMSPDAIAALLAGAGGGEPEPEPAAEEPKPTPEPEEKSSGGNMSPEDIAALLANSG